MSQIEISFKRNMVDFVGEIQNICCPNEPRLFIVKHLLETVITPEVCMEQFEKSIYTYKHLIDARDLAILTERDIWDKFNPCIGDLILAINVKSISPSDIDCLWDWMDNFCKFIEYRQTLRA
jgi:hypothetical protein